jgi:hypothetical protein
LVTPQPRFTGPQPVTSPPSSAAAQVIGVQQLPLSQTSLVSQLPQLTAGPQPLLTVPQVMEAPHTGAAHGAQVPATHLLAPLQPPHETVPLPQAFATEPHRAPASPSHSGGAAVQTPLTHCSPFGHEQEIVWPQASWTVPHSLVLADGEQVSAAQASDTPASTGTVPWATQAWSTQSNPASHPPQLSATPQESTATTPHLPVQALG